MRHLQSLRRYVTPALAGLAGLAALMALVEAAMG
jgi:hypothetical protein